MTDTSMNYDENFEPLKKELKLLEKAIEDLELDELSEFTLWLKKKKKQIADIEEKRAFFKAHTLRPKNT